MLNSGKFQVGNYSSAGNVFAFLPNAPKQENVLYDNFLKESAFLA